MEKYNYNPNLVSFKKIKKIFLCVYILLHIVNLARLYMTISTSKSVHPPVCSLHSYRDRIGLISSPLCSYPIPLSIFSSVPRIPHLWPKKIYMGMSTPGVGIHFCVPFWASFLWSPVISSPLPPLTPSFLMGMRVKMAVNMFLNICWTTYFMLYWWELKSSKRVYS